MRGARAATIFLTRIPVGGFPYSRDDWRWSSAYFPLVGLGLGAIHAALFTLCLRAGQPVAAAVTVTIGLLLTGAFHEDGLADTADALGGAYTRDKLFEILKDSRVGAFGASALVCSLLLRVLLLTRLGGDAPFAIVATQCLSRVPPIWLMAVMPYVTADNEAKSRTVARAGVRQTLVATGTGLAVLVVACSTHRFTLLEVASMVGSMALVAAICGWRFKVRAGGLTGDFLGATQQVAELALLLALALTKGGT